MPSTESQIIEVIRNKKGKANIQEITRETGLSLDYARLVCRSLGERGQIDFFNDWCYLKKHQKSGRKSSRRKKMKKRGATLASSLVNELSNYDPEIIAKLVNNGYKSLETIAAAPVARLIEVTDLELATAAKIINEAREKLNRAG